MAGAGKKTFTAGEVLTASDVNTYLMEQSVMVFAGTAARSSAIPTPSDGMVSYNQTNNSLEAYNGSEWINKSGLQLVKKQTIGSAVSSVIVTSAFSATYANYLIMVSDTVGSGTNDSYIVQMRTGSTTANTNYYGGIMFYSYAGVAGAAMNNNSTSWGNVGRGLTGGDKVNFAFNLGSPFLASKTTVSALGTIGTDIVGNYSGFHSSATSYDQFVITLAGSGTTMTGGTIYVYGYGV